MKGKFEILSPGGSLEGIKATINAGADAVYTGGKLFGAREYANNLDVSQMKEALEYAHLREKKIYLTVNTLLKDSEIEEQLYEYILPFYNMGLDAVIVQDYGVMKFIHDNFEKLPIHASTQMCIPFPLAEISTSIGFSAMTLSLILSHRSRGSSSSPSKSRVIVPFG